MYLYIFHIPILHGYENFPNSNFILINVYLNAFTYNLHTYRFNKIAIAFIQIVKKLNAFIVFPN